MKKIIRAIPFLILVLSFAIFAAGCKEDENGEAADLVMKNGIVYTVDAQGTIAEAVAVKEGAITFVGSNTEIKKYIGPDTEVIDLEGKMLLPGMIDSHLHPMVKELTELYKLDLSGEQTADGIMSAIADYIENHPEMDVYYGDLFSLGAFSGVEVEKGPRKERLDEICPDKPFILASNDGLTVWMNSKAFELAGITEETENPAGGEIVRAQNGKLWGTLKADAVKLAPPQEFSSEQKTEALRSFQTYMNSLGYTGILAVPYAYEVPFAEFRQLDQSGELSLRVNGALGIYQEKDLQEQMATLEKLQKEYSSGNVRLTSTKFFADGVVEGMSADLLQPYAVKDDHGHDVNGYTRFDYDLMKEAFLEVNKRGIQVHVHSIGDASTKKILDDLEYVKSQLPDKDCRNAITHLQLVDPDDFQRFKELNVIAVVQPYWHLKEPGWWEVVDSVMLGERAEKEYPLKSFIDAGIRVASSSDYAVTPEPNPFWAIEAGVTRNLNNAEFYGVEDITDMDDPKYLLNKDERVSVDEMIRSYTINGSYHLFRENEIGSIEVGKFADLIVVDQDITAVDPIKIDGTKVLLTIFDGKIVYRGEQ